MNIDEEQREKADGSTGRRGKKRAEGPRGRPSLASVSSQSFALHFAIALHLALALLHPSIVRSAQTCSPFTGFTQLAHPSRCSRSTLTTICLVTPCSRRVCNPVTGSIVGFVNLHLVVECGIHGSHPCAQRTLHPFCLVFHACMVAEPVFLVLGC